MEKIKAEISANYTERNIRGNYLDINFSQEDKDLWFNLPLSSEEDDYLAFSVKLNELLEAIGKAIENPEDGY